MDYFLVFGTLVFRDRGRGKQIFFFRVTKKKNNLHTIF